MFVDHLQVTHWAGVGLRHDRPASGEDLQVTELWDWGRPH